MKVEHQNPSRIHQEMGVSTWNCEEINMDIVVGLPRTRRKNDLILMIVDTLTKSVHFIPVNSTYMAEDYARIYINDIVTLHGIPLSIISHRGSQFTSRV